MMQTLRNYMKHILWIVAIAFVATIVFSWGMGGFNRNRSRVEAGVIGVINGHKIMYQNFTTAVNREIENERGQSSTEDLNDYRIGSIRDQVWRSMVRDILFAQEIKQQTIQTSAEEIVYHMRYNPPEFIQSNEQFQTDGKFDMSKYQQALNDPQNYEAWIPIENYYKSILPMQKLQQRIIATVLVTDSEAHEAYCLKNEKVNVHYVFFDANNVSMENISVSDSEMISYFKTHKDAYLEPEKRKIQYILFENLPSSEDSMQTRTDIQDLLEQIHHGSDFEELAKAYSEDTRTAAKGGDLGFFGKGSMVEPFEKAAFSAKAGEIIGPVETPFGLHLIQIVERKIENGETTVHARHILLKFKISPETSDAIKERADYFYEEVMRTKGKLFVDIAQQEGFSMNETPLFQQGTFIPGIGMSAHISRYVFQEKKGWVSQPMTAGENTIVFRISQIQKPQHKSFQEVKPSIQPILEQQKKKEKAGELCQNFWKKIEEGTDFEKAAKEESLEIRETGLFSLESSVPQIGRDANFLGAAFRFPVGKSSPPVEGDRGFYIIKVIERIPCDENQFNKEKENMKLALLKQKRQTVYMAWFDDLMKKATIQDNRDLYF